MNYSLTYVFVILLTSLATYLGLKIEAADIEKAAVVLSAIALGLAALWRRYKAGGITKLGFRAPQPRY